MTKVKRYAGLHCNDAEARIKNRAITQSTKPTINTAINDIVSIGELSGSPDNLDCTNLAASWRQYIPGIKDTGGDFTMTANMTKTFLTAWNTLVSAAATGKAAGKATWFAHMTPLMILQYLGIVTDTMKIQDLTFTANIILPDSSYVLLVRDGVILYETGELKDDPDVTWTTNRAGLFAIANKDEEAIEKLVVQSGDETLLPKLLKGVTGFGDDRFFNIVEP